MQPYRVESTLWSDRPALRLSDPNAAATALLVPSLGGNMISLVTPRGELLRCPPNAETLRREPARWGIPVLVPPNRIRDGRFRFGGREYQLERYDKAGHHSHGFALRRSWSVRQTSTSEGASVTLEFRASAYPEVLAQFPHPFVLTLTYTLRGQTLRCDSQIENEGPDPMPFGLGFHPYLAAPEEQGDRYEIRLTPARPWEMEEKFPTGRLLEVQPGRDLSRWQPLHQSRWDEGFALESREADGWSRFELADRHGGTLTTLRAGPQFGHWVVFNGGAPGFSGFVSPEPYTCMTNAFNLDLPAERSGMAVIAAGEVREAGSWELTW